MAEAILGSRGAFLALHAVLTSWCEADLVSIETVLDSHEVCLASQEVVIVSQRILSAATETCFQAVARGLWLRCFSSACAHAGDLRSSKEKLFEPLLVKMNDHHLGSRPKGLNVALQHLILSSEEFSDPQWSRHLVFHRFEKEKTYKQFEEKL